MSDFERGYDFALRHLAGSLAAEQGAEYVSSIDAAVEELRANLLADRGGKRPIDQYSGNIAEEWHAGTFSFDAAIKCADPKIHARVEHSTGYASVDVRLDTGEAYSLKYYKNGAASAKAQAKTHLEYMKDHGVNSGAAKAIEGGADPNAPMYGGMKRLIPDGQGEEATSSLEKSIASESVRRPEQVARYEDTLDNLVTKIEKDGVRSKGLSREDSKKLAREAKSGEVDLESRGISAKQGLLDNPGRIARTSLKAGATAAAVAVAIKVAPVIAAAVHELATTGEIDIDALASGSVGSATAGAMSFVSGSVSAALTEAMKSGMVGEAFKGISPGVVGAITVVAMDAFVGGVKVVAGSMARHELAASLVQDTAIAVAGLAGGSVGQVLMPVPVLGYLVGSLAGSMVGGFAYDAASKVFMSLCVEHGVTLFGLVEQDYELPIETLESIGVEVFDYEKFEPDWLEPDRFEPDLFFPDSSVSNRISLEFPRRGVIAAGRVGHVF